MTDERGVREDRPCPAEDRFLDIILEKNGGPESESLLDHLRDCDECRAKFDSLRELEPVLRARFRNLRPLARASRREIRNQFGKPLISGRKRFIRTMAVAVSGVALLVTVIALPALEVNDALERGGTADIPANPSGSLTEPPCLFVWMPVVGAENYHFKLIDEGLRLLASISTRNPWILIPADVREKLTPGRTYLWSVETSNDDDLVIDRRRWHFDLR